MRAPSRQAGVLPRLSPNIKLTHRFRWQLTDKVDRLVIYASDLSRCLSVLNGVGPTFGEPLFTTLISETKLKSIQIYSSGAPVDSAPWRTASVEWLTDSGTVGTEASRTSLSASVPLALRTSPPKNYPAYFPQGSSSSKALFQITADYASIVDVTLQFVLQDGPTAAAYDGLVTMAPAPGLISGDTCQGSLDQTSSYSANKKPAFRPVGMQVAYSSYAP